MMILRKVNDTLYVNVGTDNITSVSGYHHMFDETCPRTLINFTAKTHIEVNKPLAEVVAALTKED